MESIRVTRYEPLTFECTRCCQQFMASGKSLKQMGAEVANHIKERDPELSHEQVEKPPEQAQLLARWSSVYSWPTHGL
jgi:hypothetical protein